MRGIKAKKLRREVYGDGSRHGATYARDPKSGEVFCTGKRSKYQAIKKASKEK